MDMPGIASQKQDPLFDALCSATYSFLHHCNLIVLATRQMGPFLTRSNPYFTVKKDGLKIIPGKPNQ